MRIEDGPTYRDFYLYESKDRQQQDSSSTVNKLREAAEELAERTSLSQVQALEKIKEYLVDGGRREVIREWMRAAGDIREKKREEVEGIVDRLKDEAHAPEVGDRVYIKFNETARGTLTPFQEQVDGSEGVVRVRDPFSYGSQRSRYTVELSDVKVTEQGDTHMVHNLLPGEVYPVDDEE